MMHPDTNLKWVNDEIGFGVLPRDLYRKELRSMSGTPWRSK